MKYFLDTEFLEGSQKKTFFGKTKPTIDLISIGIIAEDGREYYAISKDFNLKEAWNRHEVLAANTNKNHLLYNVKVYWVRDNVLKPIMVELQVQYNKETGKILDGWKYKDFKKLLNKYGKSNKQIGKEIKDFIYQDSWNNSSGNSALGKNNYIPTNINSIEFYTYYGAYDWVVFCWLFGKMIDLPKGFPMYSVDLKQMMNEVLNKVLINKSIFGYRNLDDLKKDSNYPKQSNEHNALADAKWNKELYEFLNKL